MFTLLIPLQEVVNIYISEPYISRLDAGNAFPQSTTFIPVQVKLFLIWLKYYQYIINIPVEHHKYISKRYLNDV